MAGRPNMTDEFGMAPQSNLRLQFKFEELISEK